MGNVKIDSQMYRKIAVKDLTISGVASQNLFQVTGTVRVFSIFGLVDVVLDADITGAYLETDDGGSQIALTLIAGAPDISSLPIGSYIVKSAQATGILSVNSSANANVDEVIRATVFSQFVVVQKTADVATYIRLTRAGAGASGRIHWYCEWEKISHNANVVAV